MTTAKNNGLNEEKITALYCRLSVDDIKSGSNESDSIRNQKQILEDYCKKHGYLNTMFFVDDGISGTTFDRPDFKRMERMVEDGLVARIIVKDLSRFGREQVEMGRLTQVVYPSLGVDFISIQENVDTATGSGLEMMPFYNIFNEWYAAQTSKKIRQVWKTKSEHGLRVSPTVPFGYVKDANDKEIWHIDEPAAAVVRKIYSLCLAGRGPSQIARQLQEEKVLIPTAYCESMGRRSTHKSFEDPFYWDSATIVGILENRQYTGCAVNFKTTTVSYKVHKTVYNPVEDYTVIPNKQEAIIPEEDWLRVQELRSHRRRPTKTGRQSLFSGLVYCPDCGAKLHFCAAKSLNANQEFFRCSNYKDGRGNCRIHFIRNVVLEKIVIEAISNLADFVRCYEPVFLYMAYRKHSELRLTEMKKLKLKLEKDERRIVDLDKLIEKIYEDHALGNLSDERYRKMMSSYEAEQKKLTEDVEKERKILEESEQKNVDLRLLLKTLRGITEIKELTPELVNALIQRIEVHNKEKIDGHKHVQVDIYFTALGMIDIPTEKEIEAVIKEIQQDTQKSRLSA